MLVVDKMTAWKHTYQGVRAAVLCKALLQRKSKQKRSRFDVQCADAAAAEMMKKVMLLTQKEPLRMIAMVK